MMGRTLYIQRWQDTRKDLVGKGVWEVRPNRHGDLVRLKWFSHGPSSWIMLRHPAMGPIILGLAFWALCVLALRTLIG